MLGPSSLCLLLLGCDPTLNVLQTIFLGITAGGVIRLLFAI